MAQICMGCSAMEGDFHSLGCTEEECPFCGGSLAGCECIYDQLGLRDPNSPASQHKLPRELFEYGPAQEHEEAWRALLEKKGRIRFGRLSAPAWKGAGPSPATALLDVFGRLYAEPFQAPEGTVVELPAFKVEGFGTFAARIYRPIEWEDVTGDSVHIRPRLALGFEPAPELHAAINGGATPKIAAGRVEGADATPLVNACAAAVPALLRKDAWVDLGDIGRARAISQWQGDELRWFLRFQIFEDFTEALERKFARFLTPR